MPQFTPRQQDAMCAIRDHVRFWRMRRKMTKKFNQQTENELLELGHLQAFIRDELLPILEGADLQDIPHISSSSKSDSTSDSHRSSSSPSTASVSMSTGSEASSSEPSSLSSDSDSMTGAFADDEYEDDELDGYGFSEADMAAKSGHDVIEYVKSLYRTRYRKPWDNYKRPPDTLLHVLHISLAGTQYFTPVKGLLFFS
ncbi:hypothetical protein BT96DRAFT_937400 [Gymnopus androsaceus JB14]|uniref:Uncharacterized protein n=1 Tax=Gymnopus androsaceus JB14 TaxID=1447944 RepID=A0A6A4HWJ0_9AGAR|nr:hypothetical protein BT96DRAFT_937400 [Gymnopus androsaceus JB14]